MGINFMSIDTGFPTFTGKESPQEQIRALHNYMFQLREGLEYMLQNLTTQNFNTTAWEQVEEGQKDAVQQEVQKVYKLAVQINQKVEDLAGRTKTVEDNVKMLEGAVQVAEDGSVTIGAEGTVLKLVGDVYINGALYEGGGT